MQRTPRFRPSPRGATFVEYMALVAVAVSAVSVGAITLSRAMTAGAGVQSAAIRAAGGNTVAALP